MSAHHALAPPPLVSSVLDDVRSLIGVRDTVGRYLFVNAALAEFQGVPAGALIGRTPAQIGLPDFAFRPMPRLFAPEPTVVREVPLVDATGHVRLFDVVSRSVPAADPARTLMLEVATEIATSGARSAASSATEADDAAAERLDLVLRNGNLALIDWDIATDRIAPSRQLAELLGLDAHAAPATAAELALYEHPRDRERVQGELAAHLDRRSDEYYCEYRLRTASGRIRWVIASGRVIERASDGRALKYRGTLQDVTKSIETEQELQRQLSRSRDTARAVENLMLEIRRLEAEIKEVSQRKASP